MNININFDEMRVKTTKKINDVRITAFEGNILSADFKTALLQLASKVAYIDENGSDYYDDLYDALYPPIPATSISLNVSSLSIYTLNTTSQLTATLEPNGATDTVTWSTSNSSVATVSDSGLVTSVGYGSAVITATAGSVSTTCSVVVAQATVTSISAVYTQSGTVYDSASLDSLKTDLVVTAHYSDGTDATVASTDYTLSGSLTVGTSTITVTYEGKTTTFNVTVTAAPTVSSISAVYTQSGTVYDTDSLDSLKSDLVVTATWSDTSQTTVPSTDYTLSGTLTAGTSTITVTYQSKTTTFTVTVASTTIIDQDVTMTGSSQTLVTGGITYDTTKTYSFVYTFASITPTGGSGNRSFGPQQSNGATRDGMLSYLQSDNQWRAIMAGQGKNFTPADGDVLCYVHNFANNKTWIYLNGTQLYYSTTGPSYYTNTYKIVVNAFCTGMSVGISHIKIAQGDLH